MIDNGKHFDNEKYQKLCAELGIKCYFSLPMHLQVNDQVKAINKVIKHYLKTRHSSHKGAYEDELLSIL